MTTMYSKRPLPGTYLHANSVRTEGESRTVHAWKAGQGYVIFVEREQYRMHRVTFGRRVAHRWRITVARREQPEKPFYETTAKGRMPSLENLLTLAEVEIDKQLVGGAR